jgi:hypothetical protein
MIISAGYDGSVAPGTQFPCFFYPEKFWIKPGKNPNTPSLRKPA